MNDELMEQIDEWHKAEKHQEIIDALEQIPEAERDFETTGFLARAYNNIEEYAKAAELLESVREEGAEDERCTGDKTKCIKEEQRQKDR